MTEPTVTAPKESVPPDEMAAPAEGAPPIDAVEEELLERQDKALKAAHGHVTCVPGATWLITFWPADRQAPPVSWRLPDAKAAGRLISALIAPDMDLMLDCMRDVWLGTDFIDDDYLVRLSELKRRDLVRQTRHGGRAFPLPRGAEAWKLAMEEVAREVLNGVKRRGVGRPYFVVFDAKDRATAFKEWGRAVSFGKHVMSQSPGAFNGAGGPEDIVETWRACMFSPAVRAEVERNGIGKIED